MSNDLKQMPTAHEAEKAVLGAMFIDKKVINDVLIALTEQSFDHPENRDVFRAMSRIDERNESIDYISVINELEAINATVGKEYLIELGNFVPSSANVQYYLKIVKEKELYRSLINMCTSITESAYNEEEQIQTLLDKAESHIFSLAENNQTKSYELVKPILFRAMENLEALHNAGGDVTGTSTGYPDLDKLTAGWQRSDLIILAGRPSMGKTAFVLNLARNAAKHYLEQKQKEEEEKKANGDNSPVQPKSVAFFSLEMGSDQLVQRLLTMEAMIDGSKIRTGQLQEQDWIKLSNSVGTLAEFPIYIDDSPGLNIVEFRAKVRRLKTEKNVELVIIDYLQLMNGSGREESRQQEISNISRNLKLLAKELNVPIIALSQLSRAVESRNDKRPQLSDLRESGSIEQDADIVGFVHRPEYYKIDNFPDDGTRFSGMSTEGIAEIIIGKQRNGALGDVRLAFLKNFGRFQPIDLEHYDQGSFASNDPGF